MSEFHNFKPKPIAPGERFGAYILTGRSPLVNYGDRDGVAVINGWDEIAERRLRDSGIKQRASINCIKRTAAACLADRRCHSSAAEDVMRWLIQRIADWWLEEQIGDLRLHAFELHRRGDHEQANYFWYQAMGLELQRSPQQLARMETGEESGA